MLNQQQLSDRLNYICGSDAAVICGLSPFKTKVTLWLEKTRRQEQEDISNANYIKFGNYMEEGVAKWFEAESGKELCEKSQEMLIHPEHKWMAGNIDFKLKYENAILECKTALSTDGWGDGENIIPLAYLMQVAHYCAVGGFDKAYVAVVFTMTREMRWYEYTRNKELEEKLIKLEKEFWFNHVLADVAPEPISEDDVLELYKETTDTPAIADEEVTEKVYELKTIKKQKKEIEIKEKECRDKITSFMKDCSAIVDASGNLLCTYKMTSSGERFDVKSFSAENPDIYKEYIKPSAPQRRFLVKGE
jgi:putative phage-type endonuclease